MDPAGILMLRSVRIVFEMLGLQPESIKFKKEEFEKKDPSVKDYKCRSIANRL